MLRSNQILLCVIASIVTGWALSASAVDPDESLGPRQRHPLFTGDVPPGVLGVARAMGRGPVQGYFQPVAFSGPAGTQFALPQSGTFSAAEPRLMAGLLIGAVYRLQIVGIPGAEGAELFPTVELLDRTNPPPGLATRHPIPINLDQEDLEAALSGQLVTRVIYLEDPQTALPVQETPTTSRPIDIAAYQDPLEVADRFGRPVAIVRMGSLLPPTTPELMPQFYFGYPAWAPIYQPEPAPVSAPTTQP